MITYNPKDWFKLIFHLHKSDSARFLAPTITVLGIVSILTVYLVQHFWPDYHPTLTMFHQITGFVISMVLVFRINTAYDRWWEGRKQWGALVNTSRTLATRLSTMLPAEDISNRQQFNDLIGGFAVALKEHLRRRVIAYDIAFPQKIADENYARWIHKPNYIVQELDTASRKFCKHPDSNSMDYLVLSTQLTQLTDICGACERIKNTPIPYSYNMFIKKVIFLYIITMPLAFSFSLSYWTVPMVMIIFYAFASLELISEEIEDPFGTDSNDLPTDEIAGRIKENVKEILLQHETGI